LTCAENLSFLGITPADIVWVAQGDTEVGGLRDCPPTDSIVSLLLPEALVGAAENVKKEFLRRAAKMLDLEKEDLDIDDGKIFSRGRPDQTLMLAKDLMMDDDCVPIMGYNIRDNNKQKTGLGFGVWFAEVEVDTETGKVDVLQVVIANDIGQVMHASGAESQQIGGVSCIGIGEALSEELFYDKRTGTALNTNYVDYKMATLADAPGDVSPILIEEWRGAGHYGACGLAEGTPSGTAVAIANAVYNAVGVRITTVPITPQKILTALAEKVSKEAKKS